MEDYFLGVHQKELTRLDKQHTAWRPETQQLIQQANLANCASILDLGCGPGFTTFEIAKHCPSSQITALDKAALYQDYLNYQIKQQQTTNITPLHADLLNLGKANKQFDGAFCRWVLAFLIEDLKEILSAVYQKLNPGGVFAAMEYLTLGNTLSSPPNDGFLANTRAWHNFYLTNGGDAQIGTYLPDLLEEVGFTVAHQTCVGGFTPVGHRLWHWWREAHEDFAPVFVEQGLMTQAEYLTANTFFKEQESNKTGFIYSPIILQIVARKG
ncbi:MAG: class I SAM-dependent methyltransferase [Saprospiraceae bacterium]